MPLCIAVGAAVHKGTALRIKLIYVNQKTKFLRWLKNILDFIKIIVYFLAVEITKYSQN